MQIHRLEVKNFRCFEEAAWVFAPRFNLLVGDNGSGKTAIVEALWGALREFSDSTLVELVVPSEPDVRRVSRQSGELRLSELQYPLSLKSLFNAGGRPLGCSLQVTDSGGPTRAELPPGTESLRKWGERLRANVRDGDSTLLPTISYFSCHRLGGRVSWLPDTSLGNSARTNGYLHWDKSSQSLERLIAWLRDLEGLSLQTNTPIHTLAGVKTAILRCMPGASDFCYDFREGGLVLTFKSGQRLPVAFLSHGYRTVIAMVANIAYRCAVLNPQLMGEAPEKTEGIVLIDEIDLHLHPKWQRSVVESLCAAFPRLQFIATTHSPFIIQSLDPDRGDRLINLDNPAADDAENKSIEEIAEEIQDVEGVQRSQRFQEMVAAAEEYYHVLQQAQQAPPGEIEKLKQRLDTLTEPYSEDPAYAAFLKMERAAAGIDGKNGHAAG